MMVYVDSLTFVDTLLTEDVANVQVNPGDRNHNTLLLYVYNLLCFKLLTAKFLISLTSRVQ